MERYGQELGGMGWCGIARDRVWVVKYDAHAHRRKDPGILMRVCKLPPNNRTQSRDALMHHSKSLEQRRDCEPHMSISLSDRTGRPSVVRFFSRNCRRCQPPMSMSLPHESDKYPSASTASDKRARDPVPVKSMRHLYSL